MGDKKMIRVFLSVPMKGRTDEEVVKQLEEMKSYVTSSHIFGDEEIVFVHNYFYKPVKTVAISEDNIVTTKKAPCYPLLYLAGAFEKMAVCNAVMLGKDWNKYRGCRLEKDAAVYYGLPVYHCDSLERLQRYVEEAKSH